MSNTKNETTLLDEPIDPRVKVKKFTKILPVKLTDKELLAAGRVVSPIESLPVVSV